MAHFVLSVVLSIIFTSPYLRAETIENFDARTLANERQVLKTSTNYLIEVGNYEAAAEETLRFTEKYPNDSESARQLGLIYLMAKKNNKAGEAFERAVLLSQDVVDKGINIYLVAKAATQERDYKKAEQALERLKDLPPTELYAHQAIDRLRSHQELMELSRQAIEESMAQQPAGVSVSNQKKDLTATSGNAAITVGSDSNPIFVPDGSQTKNEAQSSFVSFTSAVTKKMFRYGEIDNSFSIGISDYQAELAKSFNNFRWSLSTLWKPSFRFFKENQISLSNNLEQSFQTQEGFDYYYTSDQVSLTKDFAPIKGQQYSAALGLGYRSYANVGMTDSENDRSGASLSIRGTHKTNLGSYPWTNSVGLARQSTIGGKFDSVTADFVTNLLQYLPYEYQLTYGLSYSVNSFPNNTEKSYDNNLGLGLDLSKTYRSVRGLSGKLSFSRGKNTSDAQDSNYTQDVISLWVGYEIL